MNAKTKRTADGRGALPRLRIAFSALGLLAASPAFATAPTMLDSQGRPIQASDAECADSGRRSGNAEPCVKQPKRTTYRILQNLIPQPFVTTAPPPDLPPTESVRFLPRTAFAANQAGITPELRDELYGFLTSLEGYQRIERFEIVGHSDGNPRLDYAQWLADKRTDSVRAFLVERGIAATMLEGRGVAQPDAAVRGRVEILVTVRGRR